MSEKKVEKERPIILIFADYYLPGYKSGGGMRTIVNMCDRLNERYDFRIVTRDHDGKLDKEQYKGVAINRWNEIRNTRVFYLSKDNIRISKLRELILEVRPDAIYLNSFFATLAIFVLKLRRLKLIPPVKVILAPCGELSDGALKLKSAKKKIFINFAKLAGLYKGLIWKASTELEKEEIERLKPLDPQYIIAPDMPPLTIFENYQQNDKPRKEKGSANFVFLSRFMRKKNFKWLIENLRNIRGELVIDIYGPMEDQEYWQECLELIEQLPQNIKIEAQGAIPHEEVLEVLMTYHFFIMPTLGENFGHIFLEALASGCPLLISDQTPWRELEKRGVGWDLGLNDADRWIEVINKVIGLDQSEYETLSKNARKYLVEWLADSKIEQATVKTLEMSIG